MDRAVIFDIKRYAIHDGPGIRTTVFFKGCPLHCLWCHNPEGIRPEPELIFKKNRCITGCRICMEVCPQKAISQNDTGVSIDRKLCQVCGTCAEFCPVNALEKAGKEFSATELLEQIEKDKVFFKESRGGVTFSGGEPLLQHVFLANVLEECCHRKIHTCLDTSGYAASDVVERVARWTNLFLFDLKVVDDQKHKDYTGFSNQLILKNLRLLDTSGVPLIIRIPLVPGLNDSKEDIRQAGEFIRSLKHIMRVDLLPYHDIAVQKYIRLNRLTETAGKKPPGQNWLDDIREQLAGFELNVSGGHAV